MRPAKREDIPALVSISLTSVADDEVVGFGASVTQSVFGDVDRLSSAWIQPNRVDSEEILVAEVDGRVVACTCVETRGEDLELVDIDVLRELQGQGTGKTNFLRYFVRTYREHLKPGPAIVILDVEGQFVGLESSLTGANIDKKVDILRVASAEMPGDVTLSFRAVGEKYLSHFVPELPTRTTEMLERTAHEVFVDLATRGEDAIVQRVLRDIGARATRDGRLHFSQRDAIQRAVVSPTFNLFDQPNMKPLSSDDLLVPGKTTVIDASEMSEDDQRVVAIYLMAILFEAKMKSHNDGDTSANVLLIVDEAHRLFPRHRGLKRDYVMRVAKFVEEVTHRGRKRNYGILLATQSPADISQNIVGLCETKLFFRVAGHQIWLKEHVGNKEVMNAIGNLQNFQAYVIVKGSSREPVAIGFPNVSDRRVSDAASVSNRQLVGDGSEEAEERVLGTTKQNSIPAD